ncbi:MAG: hypothetical protein IKQ40_03880 [Lachnospiraceae bacterium]|nr:hypothetical protein [Lachnospiraceae bacterium]
MAIAITFILSGCSSVAGQNAAVEQPSKPETETVQNDAETDNDSDTKTATGKEKEEDTKAVKADLSRSYDLSRTTDIEGLLEKYAVGYTTDSDETRVMYSGDIGELTDVYKDIDLNGDGKTDNIIRKVTDAEDEQIRVEYSISITDGPQITTPAVTDYKNMFIAGGDVFEFNDINNDGYDEVLYAQYNCSTAGFMVNDAYLYYVSDGKWNMYDFGDELADIAGAELTDDGIAILVDYADKWSCCFDVFMYKMDGDTVSCIENNSSYVKEYWPVKYEYSPSLASNLGDDAKAALSDIVKDISITGKLPDGTDISRFLEATEKMTSEGFYEGYVWIILMDLGCENEFGINVWGCIHTDPEDFTYDEEIGKLFAYNTDDKKVFPIGEEKISTYFKNGYAITHSDDYTEYGVCKYDPAKHGFEEICRTNEMWSDDMVGAIGDNEMISDPPQIAINKNIEIYRKLGSGLTIIDNGQKTLEDAEKHNEFY